MRRGLNGTAATFFCCVALHLFPVLAGVLVSRPVDEVVHTEYQMAVGGVDASCSVTQLQTPAALRQDLSTDATTSQS